MAHVDDVKLWRAQLDEALAEGAHPLEIALLAGSLARSETDVPDVRDQAQLTDEELLVAVEGAVDGLLDVDEEDDLAESWDALCCLDEVLAAAAWLGQAFLVRELAMEAVRVVRAFPEAWAVHAQVAREALRRAPKLRRDDAAWSLWRMVGMADALVERNRREQQRLV